MYHVDGVNPGSLADKAGIKAGEAIVRINGEEVTDGLMYGYLVCQRELRISVCDSDKDVNGKGIRDVKIVNNNLDI
jgi:S1-C subfamily serine protease